jgi:dihydrofolate synthase/folylpolyglutamate synthase
LTYQDAIQFLYELRWFGAKFGLENTFKLAEMAGNPQSNLRFIHVAGTNGKGSTCAMLESIYRTTGLRVGLFTSPHLVAFGERLQVQRQPIPESAIVRLVEEMKDLLQRGWEVGATEHPTFFEVVTVMALRYFAEQRCQLVIWETGLGGRLDATNIVAPLVSVITNIQYDHQKWLGETLASIASEKAGIIKPSVPVVTGAEEPEALKVIEDTAHRQTSPLTKVTTANIKQPPLDRLELPLLGRHQKMNAAVALATVETLQSRIPVRPEAIHLGLSQLHWPGRLQLVTLSDGRKVLLDGAHNSGGAEILAESLKEYFPGQKPTLVLGILRDKDWAAMCRTLAPLASRVLLVPVHSERTAEPHGLAEVCQEANPNVQVREYASLSEALADSRQDCFITIAGSLYLIGEAMEVLGLSPLTTSGERGLNEWTGPQLSRTETK